MTNEKLTADAAIGDWIRDFIDSDAPQFAGKPAAKRREMAIAAYYANQHKTQLEKTMNTRSLLDSIIAGDAVNIKSAFESLMSTRIAERLNGIRQATAKRMFNPQ